MTYNKNIIPFECQPNVEKLKGSEVKRFKSSEVQKLKSSEAQRLIGSEVQRFKNRLWCGDYSHIDISKTEFYIFVTAYITKKFYVSSVYYPCLSYPEYLCFFPCKKTFHQQNLYLVVCFRLHICCSNLSPCRAVFESGCESFFAYNFSSFWLYTAIFPVLFLLHSSLRSVFADQSMG